MAVTIVTVPDRRSPRARGPLRALTDVGSTMARQSLGIRRAKRSTHPRLRYAAVSAVAVAALLVPDDRLEAPFAGVPRSDALVPGHLAPVGTGAELDVKITPGKRAYGIRITDVASLAGMIRPNSRVDIMVVIYDPEHARRVAKLFMSDIRVLEIGTVLERTSDGRQVSSAVASIEVTPNEAETLAVAAAQGPLQLVLRRYSEPGSVTTSGAVPDDVLSAMKRPRSLPVKRRPDLIRPSVRPPARSDSLPPTVFRRARASSPGVRADSARSP